MEILNYGSINIDHVYEVVRFPDSGETISSISYRKGLGGKGLNQSVALARAGAQVRHLGAVGQDGSWILDKLNSEGISTEDIIVVDKAATGHARILVNNSGENSIVLHDGANFRLTQRNIETSIHKNFSTKHFLCQNETGHVSEAIKTAYRSSFNIWFNPAPMTSDVEHYPLEFVTGLIINETEGRVLSKEKSPKNILSKLSHLYPSAIIVLTLGADGAMCAASGETLCVTAPEVPVVDTTAAGDTFIGFFVQGMMEDLSLAKALEMACRAASICVGRRGASESIPFRNEV